MRKALWYVPAYLVMLIGVATMIGWLFHIRSLIQFNPIYTPMVFNTALCFTFSGIALLLCGSRSLTSRVVSMFLGFLILILAAASFSQNLFNIDLGVDDLFVKVWFPYLAAHVGRMAPNTSAAFVMESFLLFLLPFTQNKFIAVCAEILIFLIFLIGLVGLCSYLLQMQFLFNWNSYTRMAIVSAYALLILSLGFWMQWRQNPNSVTWHQGREDIKIILVSSAILLIVAFKAGITGFVSAAKQQNEAIGQTFQQVLRVRVSLIQSEIARVFLELNAVRDNPLFQDVFKNKINNAEKLQSLLQLFMSEGFSSIELYDHQGRLIAKRGEQLKQPDMKVMLNLPEHPYLFWKNGWYLRIRSDINTKNPAEGFMLAEWPLIGLNNSLTANLDMGNTADLVICAAENKETAQCFPSRLRPTVFNIQRMTDGARLPMDYALSNETGTVIAYDGRHHQVLAAYSPVGTLGLGMVLKMDLREIYAPTVRNLHIVMPTIVIFIIIGILLLRLSVMPLIRKVINAERKLTSSNKLLQESQERYDLAVVGSQVGLWDWWVGTDQIFYSPFLKKMLGYTDAQLPNTATAFQRLLHPDDRERAKIAVYNHVKNHLPYNIEYRLLAKNGEYLWFQVMGQALWNDGLAVRMAGSIMDITGRKRNQQRQAAQHVATQLLSEATSLEEVAPKIIRAICEGMGWQYGAIWMVGNNEDVLHCVGMWIPPDAQMESFKKMSNTMKFEKNVGLPGTVWATGESCWVTDLTTDTKKNPRYKEMKIAGLHSAFAFPISLGFNVSGVVEFFMKSQQLLDESTQKMLETVGPQIGQFIQRKAVEKELRESEAHKSAILESASDSIITMNDVGNIVSFNARTEIMFGYSADALYKKNTNDLVPGILRKMIRMKGNIPVEFVAKRSDGSSFPAELTIAGMFVNDEHRFVSIIRDITERKKIDALKNEFVSVVSHELRTPLTSILGSLSLILGGAVGKFSEKAEHLLKIANKNCERLLLLINDILDIEKIEAGKMVFNFQALGINQLIINAIDVNQMYADKFSVKLTLSETAPEVKVYVDADRFMQVMTNLISNAAKFSPAGGEVNITVRTDGQSVRVSVIDNGIGVADEFKSHIFQKFTQADTSSTRIKDGTGLGLNISKMIVEKFRGKLNFSSIPNVETVFYFDLPQWTGVEEEHVVASADNKSNKLKLLICEDDVDQANYLQALLQSSDFYVDVAANAAQAKELLNNQKYDALLLDLILPDQDGISFIRELRTQKATQSLPIIVVSVMAETGRSLMNGDAFSIVDWLEKPVDFSKLLKVIQLVKKSSAESRPCILHVEDDPTIQKLVFEVLQGEAGVENASTLQEAQEKLMTGKYDLIILDLLLPDGNGVELLPLLSKFGLPVVVFSTVELDAEYAKYVTEILIKSETTNQALLERIKKLLKKQG